MGQVTFNKLCTELEHYIVRRERKYKKLWKSLREKRGSPLICPKDDQEDYHNRKGFYSSVLQGFVDSHLCFRNINVSLMFSEYQHFLARTCP